MCLNLYALNHLSDVWLYIIEHTQITSGIRSYCNGMGINSNGMVRTISHFDSGSNYVHKNGSDYRGRNSWHEPSINLVRDQITSLN